MSSRPAGLVAEVALDRGGFALRAGLAAPPGEITAVVGPSGAGKSTLLRSLAGLEPACRGRIAVGDEVWLDSAAGVNVAPHRRRVGVVFQDARLFPHLDVDGNLAYGWKRRAPGPDAPDPAEVAGWLGLAPLLGRPVDALSGGERQRVALGRALLSAPDLLLLDEPLASLDAASKGELLPYIAGACRRLQVPTIYVTHSRGEVLRLADGVVLLVGGAVAATGSVGELAPRLDVVPPEPGDDLGAVVEAVVEGHDEADALTFLRFAGGSFAVPRLPAAIGERHRLRLLARDVSLALARPQGTSILNVFAARVVALREEPASPGQQLVELEVTGERWVARVTRRSARELALAPGLAVYAQVKAVALS